MLHRALIEHDGREVQDADVDSIVEHLVARGLLERAVPVERGPTLPALPNLPGVPKLRKLEVRLPHDPKPGEPCYAGTPLGRKAARICTGLRDGSFALWLLGAHRLVDQALLVFHPPFGATAAEIDVACCTATCDEVTGAIEGLLESGLMERQEGGRFVLTLRGEGRRVTVAAEFQGLWLGVRTTAPDQPSPPHVLDLRGQLGFMRNAAFVSIVERDLGELDAALRSNLPKASLLLAGSVLEGILLDVLDRNRPVAQSYMTGHKKWPTDASLPDLIRIATAVDVRDGGGATTHLLTKTTADQARSITDHRDLIHPHAETRTSIRIDRDTAHALALTLRLVVRDLADADARGLLRTFET